MFEHGTRALGSCTTAISGPASSCSDSPKARRRSSTGIVLGTDGPAGSGVQPIGILRTITCWLARPAWRRRWPGALPPATRRRCAAWRRGVIAKAAPPLVSMDQAMGAPATAGLDSIAIGNLPASAW